MPAQEFYGESLKACLEQVKATLGSDAIIVETKKVRQGGGLMGIQGREVICVVAMNDDEYDDPAEPEETDKDILAIRDTLSRLRSSATQAKQSPVPPARPANPPASPISPSSIAAARSAYKSSTAPPTRLDNARPASSASTSLYRKATFPTVERPAQNGGASPFAPPQPARPAPPPQSEERYPAPPTRLPARESASPPGIRNLTPLSRPNAQPENKGQGGRAAENKATNAETERQGSESVSELRQNLQQLRARFSDYEKNLTAVVGKGGSLPAMSRPSASSAYPELKSRLRTQGVGLRLIEDLMREIPDLSGWGEQAKAVQAEVAMRDLIAARIPCAGSLLLTPGRLKSVALIGPTGVGKTTTIAKLAALYALLERKRVALLTIDTYRIAAIEQLKTYSQIMDIPVHVAHEAREIPGILAECRNYDLLLADTAGRSQFNATQVMELKPFLEALQCETHLVLSANTKEDDMMESARRFAATRVDRLIFTKLDETTSYGSLLNIADKTGVPLTYLTTGQKVPEDIEVATGAAIGELILP